MRVENLSGSDIQLRKVLKILKQHRSRGEVFRAKEKTQNKNNDSVKFEKYNDNLTYQAEDSSSIWIDVSENLNL